MFLLRVRSIRTKLVLLIAASVGTAVFLSFAVGSYRELSRFGEAKRAELEATAQVLAATVADAVAGGDRGMATRALNAISRIPAVRFAEIRTGTGTVFAEAGTGVALAVDSGAADDGTSFWSMLTRGSMLVDAEVIKGGRQVGHLILLVDTSDLYQRLKQALAAAALSAVAAIVIGFGIASRLQRSITRPLGALTLTMNRIRLTSDFSQKAERHSDDETGQLVDSFNDMLDQIRGRDRALEDHLAGLERTVEVRTRELADARDVAESANRAKSDFLATMSHEIRTPMNGMLVMAELLAGTELPARQQRYAETIVRSGQTLLTIINDILDLSKIEAGKLELEQGRVPIATVVDDVLGLFWERASSKRLDLAASIGADVPAIIESDPVRLSQILSNLVNNALKFTEDGHVKLTVEVAGRTGDGGVELLFSVADTGIGIPADKVEHIFEAFSQADQSTTRRFGGTGLGLSICQRLVGAMDGRIWAESQPGQGSVFRFTTRVRVLEEAAEPPPPAGRSALLALEGEATVSVIADELRRAGYSVHRATDDAHPTGADVVFAGVDHIEADGGALKATRGAQVICVAGFGDGNAERLLGAGLADGVLVQPVSSSRVGEILDAVASGTLASLADTRRSEPAADLPALSGLHVLVADDSPVNREVAIEALSRLGARASTVEDGRQAVAAFQRGQFDIVLMDCSMPEMDGFAATRAIRAWEAERGLARTPVVALTAHAAGVGDSWREAGMDDYLTKPFTMRRLADCLTRWRVAGTKPAPGSPELPATAEQGSMPAGLEAGEPLDASVLASLRAIAGGNGAMLDRIFGLFQAHAPARHAALEGALAAEDLDRVASEAHALKSPSLNIGALRLAALCSEIEAEARSGDRAVLTSPKLARLSTEMELVRAAIEHERGSRTPATRGRSAVAFAH